MKKNSIQSGRQTLENAYTVEHHTSQGSASYMEESIATMARTTTLGVYADVCHKQADPQHKKTDHYTRYSRARGRLAELRRWKW